MLESFDHLWNTVRSSAWFNQLPDWLREPPGLFFAGGAVLFLVIFALLRLIRRRRYRDSVRSEIVREIRQLRRQGDELGAGQRWENLGEADKALAAYRRGGHHAEYARLLLEQGRRAKAKEAAKAGEVWGLYGELSRDDEDFEEAATAFERAGKLYDAARAWESAGKLLKAAKCYVAIDMGFNAVQLLMDQEGRVAAQILEKAIRSALAEAHDAMGGAGSTARAGSLTPDMVRAVHRCAQLWLADGEAEQAYQLAVDCEEWSVAVPIARDYLDPNSELVDVCLRAEAFLVAAEIAERLGDTHREALCRAEHFQRQDDPAESARWFEKAEAWTEAADQWAAAGEVDRAAEMFTRAEEYEQAAQLYVSLGDTAKAQAMRDAARARDPRAVLEAEDETRRVRPQPHPAGEPPTRAALPAAGAPPAPAAGAPAAGAPAAGAPAAGDRYKIEGELGRGGMGVVYRAQDLILQRPVAYKVLSADVTGAVQDPNELLKEAQAAAKLSHPNIVQVYDAGPVASGFFVVMELIEGENFAELLKKRKLSVPGAISVGRQICAALGHAHSRLIVHRDLKPSNLLLTSDNVVKLTDFGLARIMEGSGGQVLTRPAGTPYYMAPEQIRGEAVDAKTDLYSLGCVLFELLCNHTPFTGGGSSIYHHLNSPPQDPRLSRREIPEGLAAIILKCLEKDPADRPKSAAAIDGMLAALTSGHETTRR